MDVIFHRKSKTIWGWAFGIRSTWEKADPWTARFKYFAFVHYGMFFTAIYFGRRNG
jgi:hypothetical protein